MSTLRPLILTCLVFAGCSSGPDHQRPPVDLPQAFEMRTPSSRPIALAGSEGTGLAPASAVLGSPPVARLGGKELLDMAWWSGLRDPQLDALIDTAIAQNQDLRIAALRIEQFDAYLQVSRSAGLPKAGIDASRTRDTLSENRQIPLVVGAQPVDNAYSAALFGSWELDLWGKVRRSNESALAELSAREENRRALMQSLVSEVVAAYVRLLALDREVELLNQTLASFRETLTLAEARFAGGRSAELPVIQARAELLERLPELPAKEAEIAVLENRLNGLAGRDPGPISRGKTLATLDVPLVPASLPADLLVQRPDIRVAEQELIAANAKIGVAKAQYLPTISLTASSGFASNELSKLTMLTSNFGSFGVNLLGPLFTAGRIEGQIREAEAVQKQAAVAFVRVVQTALREVEDALTTHAKLGQQLALREVQLQTLRYQLNLAQRRFDGGYSGYFEVLEIDRALTSALQLQNQAKREHVVSLIAVYKAMGGGWSLPAVTAQQAAQPKNVNE
jgi:outer membrane protein, multidrug efflux system